MLTRRPAPTEGSQNRVAFCVASANCGFAASGIRFNDTHPSVAWLKFAALAEGARLATRQLWGR
jgi:hypothetical protein